MAIPTVETTIQASIRNYPSLYGRSRLRVLSHLFTTNGNGYDWCKGALYGRTGTCPEKKAKPTPTWPGVIRMARESLRHPQKGEELAHLLGKARESYVTGLCMLDRLYTPIPFYSLDTGDYSKLGHLPKDIRDDWLAAAALTLLFLLHYRCSYRRAYYVCPGEHYKYVSEEESQHTTHNHAHALILLCRYEQMFGQRKAWRQVIDHPEVIAPYYRGAKFWEIRERREAQLFSLSCKCGVKEKLPPYGLSEDPVGKLSAAEYLDYFEVDPTGFERHLPLLVQLHHRKWLDRHKTLKQRADRQQQDTAIRQALGKGELKGESLLIPAPPEVLAAHRLSKLIYA